MLPLIWPTTGKPSIIDTRYAIKIPKGTTVHVGESTQQGGIFLGGAQQIAIEESLFIDGVKVIEKFPLYGASKYVREP